MIVEHRKDTLIAWAPEELARAQRAYGHDAYVNTSRGQPDIIHFHNKAKATKAPAIVQYHSLPESFMVDLEVDCARVVLAQAHALLPEYKDLERVRNVINFEDGVYANRPHREEIRIGYSPSRTQQTPPSTAFEVFADKGFPSTVAILEEVARKRPDISFDLITYVPLYECLRRKAACTVIIDEVVTDGYHRSALEGLAFGAMTVCSLSEGVKAVLLEASGAKYSPLENVHLPQLEQFLLDLDLERVMQVGQRNRLWMEKYWHPRDIVAEYDGIYRGVLEEHHGR